MPNASQNIAYSVKRGDTLYELAKRYHTTVDAILAANPGVNFRMIYPDQVIVIPAERASEAPAVHNNFKARTDIRDALRSLWEQHVAWTRMAIISAASDNPDLNLVVARLLRNADDMAAALTPFYGEAKAKRFGDLIRQHLNIALQLVKAAKAGNNAAAKSAEAKWYANADQIADYLNTINPFIPKEEFRKMFYNHLAQTKAEAVERLQKNYSKDIALYDQIERQALQMADMMSDGIIKQKQL